MAESDTIWKTKYLDLVQRQEGAAADPAGATDAQLDELIALLAKDAQPAISGQENEPSPGLLGRLLGRDKGDEKEDHGCASVRQLLTLLLKLNWPDRLKQDLAALFGRDSQVGGKESVPLRRETGGAHHLLRSQRIP